MSGRRVPVRCEACGADEMVFTSTALGPDTREDRLTCACGEVALVEVRRREQVSAIVCGPGHGGAVIVGDVWAVRDA